MAGSIARHWSASPRRTAIGARRPASAARRSIAAWLAADGPARGRRRLGDLHGVCSGRRTAIRARSPEGLAAAAADYGPSSRQPSASAAPSCWRCAGVAVASLVAAGLRAGQRLCRGLCRRQARDRRGRFRRHDPRRRAACCSQPGIGDWVRFKLDQTIDHILVDEAQDTNAAQWAIVASLADEFFVERGHLATRNRTIFTVGDYKQAIFGFQGTSPRPSRPRARIFGADAAEGGEARSHDLSLDRPIARRRRSWPWSIALIERVSAPRRWACSTAAIRPRTSARGGMPGSVTLWAAGRRRRRRRADDSEEGWVDDATRRFADRLARQVRRMARASRLARRPKGRRVAPGGHIDSGPPPRRACRPDRRPASCRRRAGRRR